MTIREFLKGIIENAFTDAEIIKYCKALDSELLADLLKELWAEYVSCDYVGELSNAQRLKNAYDLICERFNVDIWEEEQRGTDTQNSPEPQQEQVNSEQAADTQNIKEKPHQCKRGRPKYTFKDLMIEDEDGKKLEKLHKVIDGKRGKSVVLYIKAAMSLGWMRKPTYSQATGEFGDIGVKESYNKPVREMSFTDELMGEVQAPEAEM